MIVFESILKPKSQDDIDSAIGAMDPDEMLFRGITSTFSNDNGGVRKNLWMIEYAIKKGADPSKNGARILGIAASRRSTWEALSALMKFHKFTDTELHDALWEAINNKNIFGVHKLIEAGADPLSNNMEIFVFAIEKQDYRTIEYLLKWAKKKGVDINKPIKGSTLLETLLKRGDIYRLIFSFVKYGAIVGDRKDKARKAAIIGDEKFPNRNLIRNIDNLIRSEEENDSNIFIYGKSKRKYTKKTNESISILRPKSNEEIITELEKLPPNKVVKESLKIG